MTFKHAQLGDIEWVSHLVGEFYKGIGNEAYQIPFDPVSMHRTVAALITRGICLIGPTSTAAAFTYDFPFNLNYKIAYVQFWTFKNAREIRIFDALLDECEALGARHVVACSHPPKNTIGRHYKRLGGRQHECGWMFEV
jgi:hypothetical protein